MSWLVSASRYIISLDGQAVVDEQEIGGLIKDQLKKSRVVQKLFELFALPLDELDTLDIEILPLKKKYALTDEKKMKLNKSLFDKVDFFKDYMFVPVHELVHFVARKRQKATGEANLPKPFIPTKPTESSESYFDDDEESMGFMLSVAYELENNKPIQHIWKHIYPKVEWHFHDESDAEKFFKRIILKARRLLNAQQSPFKS